MDIFSPRIFLNSISESFKISCCSKLILPEEITALLLRRFIAAEITVLFPHPLSPTIPTTLFSGTSKLTLRTACTGPVGVSKSMLKFSKARILDTTVTSIFEVEDRKYLGEPHLKM